MAKKRRLNKRVVALLAIGGAAILILAVIVFINSLPKDVNYIQRLIAKADEGQSKGDLLAAERNYAAAIAEAGKSGETKLAAQCMVKWAKVQLEWIKSPMIPQSERMERYKKAKDALGASMRLNPQDSSGQRLLAEVTWDMEVRPRFQAADAPWEDYRKTAERLLELEPQNHLVWYHLGIARTRLAEVEEGTYKAKAVEAYRKAIEIKNDEAEYWVALARHQQRFDKDKGAAEAVFKEGIEANPDLSALRVTYAEYLLSQGEDRKNDALEELKEAKNRDPKNNLSRLALARYYMNTGQAPEARRLFEEARVIDPLDTRPYRELAALHAREGKLQLSLAVLRSGLDALAATTQPATTPAATSEPTTAQAPPDPLRIEAGRAELSMVLAGYLLDAGEANPAEQAKYIEQAKECIPRFELQIPAGSAKIKGRIAFTEGRFDEAGKLLEPLVKEPFFDAQAAYLLVHIYRFEKLPGKAAKLVEEFVKKVAGAEANPMVHVLMAQIKMDFRAYEDADKEIGTALRLQNDNPQALEMRKLLNVIRTLIIPDGFNLSPQARATLLDRVDSLWKEERRDEATKLAEAVYARYPEDLNVVRAIVTLYALDKKQDPAKGIIIKAIEKYPDNAELKVWLKQIGVDDPAKLKEMRLAAADAIADPLQKNLEKAETCMAFGDGANAARFTNEAAAINPNHLRVIDLQFRLVLAMNNPNWEMAQDCAKRAAAQDKFLGHSYAARIAMSQGKDQLPAAIEELTAILRDRQEDKQARVMLGECFMRQEKWQDAEREFKQVATVDPGFAQAIKGMAIVTENQNRPVESAQWVKDAYRLMPQDPYIRKRFIDNQDENLDPATAIKKREEWRTGHPDDGQNILRLAYLYDKTRQFEEAEKAYMWLKDHGSDTKSYLFGARQLLLFYHRTSRPEDINKLLNEVVNFATNTRSAGDKAGAMILSGDIHALQGKQDSLDAAMKAYKEAVDYAAVADPKDVRPWLAMVQFYAAQGQWEQAANEQRKVLKIAPGSVNEKMLAKLLIEGRQYKEAEQYLNSVLSREAYDPEALADKAVMQIRNGFIPEALKTLNDAVGNNPNLADPLIRRAMLLAINGEPDKAKDDLTRARSKTSSPDTLRQVGGIFERLQDFEKAEEVYRDILVRQEDYRPVLGDLLNLYMQRRNWERFDLLATQAMKLYPQYVPFLLMQAKSYEFRKLDDKRLAPLEVAVKIDQDGRVLYEYWVALLDNDKADKVMETSDKYMSNPKYRVLVLAVRARAKFQQKKASEADDLFKSALKEARAGDVAFVLGQAEKAYGVKDVIAKMEGWSALQSSSWFYPAQLGAYYARTKDPQNLAKAMTLLNKALDLAKEPQEKGEVEAMLGMTCHQANKPDESEKHYLASLAILPDNANCLNNLAYLYADVKNAPDKALPHAEKAAKLLPENPDILDTLGWIYVKLNRYEQADTALLRAIRVENSAPVCRYHLGFLREQQGKFDEAKKQYQMVIEITGSDKEDPTYKLAKDGLDRVEKQLQKQPTPRSGT